MRKQDPTTLNVYPETRDQLRKIAEAERRNMKEQLAVLVANVYREKFDIVKVDELPRPEGAEPVKVVYVQRRTE